MDQILQCESPNDIQNDIIQYRLICSYGKIVDYITNFLQAYIPFGKCWQDCQFQCLLRKSFCYFLVILWLYVI